MAARFAGRIYMGNIYGKFQPGFRGEKVAILRILTFSSFERSLGQRIIFLQKGGICS